MNDSKLACKDCGTVLRGEIDTFGSLGHERCWPCQSAYVRKRRILDRLDVPDMGYFTDVERYVAAEFDRWKPE